MYKIIYTKRSEKALNNYRGKPVLLKRLKELVNIIKADPFQPPYEKLVGGMAGAYSRRVNIQHRLVYRVEGDNIIILSVWNHYE